MNAKISKSNRNDLGMTSAEEKWFKEGGSFLLGVVASKTTDIWFEPMTFHFGTISYKVDFMHQLEDDSIVFVEVKASRFQRGFDKTYTKIRALAKAYPFKFFIVVLEKDTWNVKEIS